MDLFMDWHRRADFGAAVGIIVGALQEHGYLVEVALRSETFARLSVRTEADRDAAGPDAAGPDAAGPDKVELSADWRAHPPVLLDVGPVLHPDDAIANKMCALYSRALPRDFLDIGAALTSGRYTPERLLALASEADGGFDVGMFAHALGALSQITDSAFAEYDVPSGQVSDLRQRFGRWRAELLGR